MENYIMLTLTPQSTGQHEYVFENKYPIRVIERDGDPWFVAADVCAVLDLSNISQAVSRLDEDEKGDIISNDTAGRPNRVIIINESGLYSLILSSRKPEAKAFKRWITHEVIPAIRRTGQYTLEPMTPLQRLRAFVDTLEAHEGKLAEHDIALETHDQRINVLVLEAVTHVDEEYYAVTGYFNLRKLKAPTKPEAAQLGKRAAARSRDLHIEIKEMHDPRYGTVNMYHIDVLDELVR
jgi:prophage antirepressor-like protein